MTPFTYKITGRPEGDTFVFLHGWPDDSSLWDKQLPAFQEQYRCVLITFPNFGEEHDVPGGANFREIIARLHQTITDVSPERPVTLISHDWGAYISYLYERAHQDKVTRMITMDIGGHMHLTPFTVLLICAYQWLLICLWLVGGLSAPLGNALNRGSARLLKVPAQRIPRLESKCNYMYFYLWKAMLFPFFGAANELLHNYQPTVPVLFLYGERKPFPFHSSRWLDMVQRSGGQSNGFANGDHWFLLSDHEEVNATIVEWLATQEK